MVQRLAESLIMILPQHLSSLPQPSSLSIPTVRHPRFRATGYFGADTSLWPPGVDFDKYKLANASFVIIKALHGVNIDPFFSRNYARARAAGIPVSTYQWLLPESVRPITEQVRTYADLLRDFPHDFVPWLDYE
jgi:GH25 family lysozyme M1 (1,4-beta-N-acetylmuramidase)